MASARTSTSKGRRASSALTLPAGTRTIVVYGGTFDPPHRYHLEGARRAVRAAVGRSGVVILYVPAARNPLKRRPASVADDDRLAMLEAALAGRSDCVLWQDEIDRAAARRSRGQDRPSYTIDTLRRLRRRIPSRTKLRLLIGADQAAQFHRWGQPRSVIRLAEPIVVLRAPIATKEALELALRAARVATAGARAQRRGWTDREVAAWLGRVACVRIMAPSATRIRASLIKAPLDATLWRRHPVLRDVPAAVARVIAHRGLYRRAKRALSAKSRSTAIARSD